MKYKKNMLKFWRKSEKNQQQKSRRVNFQEEVTIVQSLDEVQTFKQPRPRPLTASRKFKLFSVIKWGSKKRKRKSKKSNSTSIVRKKSAKKKPKGRKIPKLEQSGSVPN